MVADPIGALLDPSSAATPAPASEPDVEDGPDETPATAPSPSAQPVPAPPPAPTLPTYIGPTATATPPPAPWSAPVAPRPPTVPVNVPPRPRTARDAPVHIDEVDRTPEGPPSPVDLSYEARLRASFAAAQGMQGPLDGRWTLISNGEALYDFQLVDTGSAPLEGVWRDLRRPAAPEATGFLTDISRTGGQLSFTFQPTAEGPAATVILVASPEGRWSGEMVDAGRRKAVALRRD